MVRNIGYAVAKLNLLECRAVLKHRRCNFCNAVADFDIGECRTIRKNIFTER